MKNKILLLLFTLVLVVSLSGCEILSSLGIDINLENLINFTTAETNAPTTTAPEDYTTYPADNTGNYSGEPATQRVVTDVKLNSTQYNMSCNGEAMATVYYSDGSTEETIVKLEGADFYANGTYVSGFWFNENYYSCEITVDNGTLYLPKYDNKITNISVKTNYYTVSSSEQYITYFIERENKQIDSVDLKSDSEYYVYYNVDFTIPGYYLTKVCIEDYVGTFVIAVNNQNSNDYLDITFDLSFNCEQAIVYFEDYGEISYDMKLLDNTYETYILRNGVAYNVPIVLAQIKNLDENYIMSHQGFNSEFLITANSTNYSYCAAVWPCSGVSSMWIDMYAVETSELFDSVYENGNLFVKNNFFKTIDPSKILIFGYYNYFFNNGAIYNQICSKTLAEITGNYDSIELKDGYNYIDVKNSSGDVCWQFSILLYDGKGINYAFNPISARVSIDGTITLDVMRTNGYYADNGDRYDYESEWIEQITISVSDITSNNVALGDQTVTFKYGNYSGSFSIYFYDPDSLRVTNIWTDFVDTINKDLVVCVEYEQAFTTLYRLSSLQHSGNIDYSTSGTYPYSVYINSQWWNLDVTISTNSDSWVEIPREPVFITKDDGSVYTDSIIVYTWENGRNKLIPNGYSLVQVEKLGQIDNDYYNVRISYKNEEVWNGCAYFINEKDIVQTNFECEDRWYDQNGYQYDQFVMDYNNQSAFLNQTFKVYYSVGYILSDGRYISTLKYAEAKIDKNSLYTVESAYNKYRLDIDDADINIPVFVYTSTEQFNNLGLICSEYCKTNGSSPIITILDTGTRYIFNDEVYDCWNNITEQLVSIDNSMIQGNVDFTTTGQKHVYVTYLGQTYEFYINIW